MCFEFLEEEGMIRQDRDRLISPSSAAGFPTTISIPNGDQAATP